MVQFGGDNQDDADARRTRLIDALGGDRARRRTSRSSTTRRTRGQSCSRSARPGSAPPPTLPGEPETWEGWEDSAVPPERLGDYLRDLRELLDEFGYATTEPRLYGHFGQGCVHTRIPFDLRTADGVAPLPRLRGARRRPGRRPTAARCPASTATASPAASCCRKMFGDELVARCSSEVKALFDPGDRMNPGKVVHPDPLDEHLRLGADWTPREPSDASSPTPTTTARFAQAATALRRHRQCRSTRTAAAGDVPVLPGHPRGGALHPRPGPAAVRDARRPRRSPTDGWRSTEVRDALDLCLACKGCKSDCPVNVDMATYKAEFLAHHYRAPAPAAAAHYSMGWLPRAGRGSPAAAARAGQRRSPSAAGSRRCCKRLGGIDAARRLPAVRRRSRSPHGGAPAAAPDAGRGHRAARCCCGPTRSPTTSTPASARAAVAVLEDAGCEVARARPSRCAAG